MGDVSGFLFGDYRRSICKGGPRVLTFVPGAIGDILVNAPACEDEGRWSTSTVLGEDFVDAGDPGKGGQPLVLGWYELQAEVDLYWQQVDPTEACDTDPYRTGRFLPAGGSVIFFVDAANRDGIIVIKFLSVTPTVTTPSGLARVNRIDTTRTMVETGESAEYLPEDPSRAALITGQNPLGTSDNCR